MTTLISDETEWRETVGSPGYAVNALGQVKRTAPCDNPAPGGILKHQRDNHDYPMVHLWICGKRHGIKVHRLVAEAFLGPKPSPKHAVAHNDGNPKNTAVTNLRWATLAENQADRIKHGTSNRGERQGISRLKEADIRPILEARRAGETVTSIARRYDVHRETIGMMLRGRSWSWLTGISPP